MTIRALLGAACAAALLPLTACAESGEGSVSDDSPEGTNAGQQEQQSEAEETSSPEPQEMPRFGQTFTFDNGLAVKIGKPRPYELTEYASADQAPAYVQMEVTVVNNTGEPYDPSGFFTTVQSGDQEAGEVFDTDGGLDGSPSTTVLDGRQARFALGYGVQNARDIVMDVDTGAVDEEFNSFAVTFTS